MQLMQRFPGGALETSLKSQKSDPFQRQGSEAHVSTDLFSLQGKRILVTGGGRGLGRALAEGLHNAGGQIALVSRTPEQVDAAARSIGSRAVGLPGDVGTEDPAKLLDRVESVLDGPVDVVLHAAGIQHRQPAEEFDRSAWEQVLHVNLTAPFLLSQEIGRRQLVDGRHGSHIFIGSVTSRNFVPNVAAYMATKSGIDGVTRSLSGEWSGSGVRANAIGPGYFRTEMTEPLFRDKERYQKMLDRIPMGRFGNPEELVGAAVFLASDAASYVTGQMLMVDGGWTTY